MKSSLKRLIAAIAIALIIAIPVGSAFADVGGFSGGSSYSSSSSSSSSWSSSGSSSSSDGGGSIGGSLFWIVVVVGFLVYDKFKKKNGDNKPGSKGGIVHIEDSFDKSKLQNIASITQADPNFSEADLREKLANWYVRMQNAWTAKDFEPMRPFFSDALFAQLDRQLSQITKQGQTNYVDRIAVLGVEIEGWYTEGDEQMLSAIIRTRIVDYTMDDASGKIVSGSNNEERFMTYRWVLSRSTSTQTAGASGMTTVNCPNCAAALNINQTSRCPYCDSIITLDKHDWVITAMQGLEQIIK